MIKRTRWKPDTCGCAFEFEWDTDQPQETRTHTPVSHVTCPEHTGRTMSQAWTLVLAENRMKNDILNRAQNTGDFGEDATGPEGDTYRRFQFSKRLAWSFDGTRKLVLKVPPSVTEAEKTRLQALAESRYPGKVVVR